MLPIPDYRCSVLHRAVSVGKYRRLDATLSVNQYLAFSFALAVCFLPSTLIRAQAIRNTNTYEQYGYVRLYVHAVLRRVDLRVG